MEKLIELLKDKYWEVVTYNIQSDWGYMFHINWFAVREERLLSKKYWFIKWLVDNDKIDCNKSIFTVDWDYDRDHIIYEITEKHNYYILNEQYWVDFTDCILMLLSISDTPIEDLISYLR